MKSKNNTSIRVLAGEFWEAFFPKSPLYDSDAIEQRIVARFSRGSLRLQKRRYPNREQLDEILAQARADVRKRSN